MKTEQIEDGNLTYDDSPEAKDRVFNIMLNAFKKLGQFEPEVLGQADEVYIEAPIIMGDCAVDGFRFKVDYED